MKVSVAPLCFTEISPERETLLGLQVIDTVTSLCGWCGEPMRAVLSGICLQPLTEALKAGPHSPEQQEADSTNMAGSQARKYIYSFHTDSSFTLRFYNNVLLQLRAEKQQFN